MTKRYQAGCIWKQDVRAHIKYYATEMQDGKPVRVQKSEKLCDLDGTKYYWTGKKPCAAVRLLADKVMARVNYQQGAVTGQDVKIADFWKDTFLPSCEKQNADGVPNTKASTRNGWVKIWKLYLAPYFMDKTLTDYTTQDASLLLSNLSDNPSLGTHTVGHARSLAHRIFKHAIGQGLILHNPFTDASPDTKPRKANETHAYTLAGAQRILAVLADEPEARLMYALAQFCGLRPGEISGLRWNRVDGSLLHIAESVWRGQVSTPKTQSSVASVEMISPVVKLLNEWREMANSPQPTDWIFPNKNGAAKSAEYVAYNVIKPLCEQAGVYWDGLYSARRGASTCLTELTGNALAASVLLRHRTVKTTEAFYTKLRASMASEALQLLEERVNCFNLLPAPAPVVPAKVLQAGAGKDGQ